MKEKKKLQVVWSNSAKSELRRIYEYYRDKKQTPQGAKNVRADILKAGKSILFETQFQRDEIEPEYRRVIVRDYKLLYREISGKLVILKIFSTPQDPDKQLDN